MEKSFVLRFASDDEERGVTANKRWNAVNSGAVVVAGGTLVFGEDTVIFGADEVEF
jgi:hypothetical protein